MSIARLAAVVAAAQKLPPESFKAYGGGWPTEISTALLDAVFSIRAVYRSQTPGVGVRGRLETFRRRHPNTTNDLAQLVKLGAQAVEEIMGSTKTAQRLKSEVVVEAARGFCGVGVTTADGFRNANVDEMKAIYTSVRGLGWITFEYFGMHLGIPGTKADTMVTRFVNRCLAEKNLGTVAAADARALIVSAYEETNLGATLMHFDHAVWRSESDTAAGR